MVFYRLNNPQKAKKVSDSGPRAGKSGEKWVKSREMYEAGHKLRSKTRIVGNFNTERLRYIMGLFTWREEDPSTRKILEGGITLRWVYMQKFRPVSCPSREG